MVPDMQNMNDLLGTIGYTAGNRKLLVQADGKHKEWFWGREFPAAYQWLFGDITGIADNNLAGEPDNRLLIYPNPASMFVDVNCGEKIYSIRIFDVQGKLVHCADVNDHSTRLDTSMLNDGSYVLIINAASKNYSRKMIVKHP